LLPETRILFSYRFGSHGQRFLLAVGFRLPTAHAHGNLCGDRDYTKTGISRATPLAS
jgi:hypothetical protein